jgi:hypothetical protein
VEYCEIKEFGLYALNCSTEGNAVFEDNYIHD